MSLFRHMNVSCPNCGAAVNMSAVGSVNADRRPDLREAILGGGFQDETCGACGTSFRLQPEFNYLDMGRGQWIMGLPAERMPDWLVLEDESMDVFNKFYGNNAPAAARDIGRDLRPRLTFGWPAIREKLLLREHGLDDVIVEMLKLEMLRRVLSAPLAPGIELRLVSVGDDVLSFAWVNTATEETVEQLGVRRALLDAISENADGWMPIRVQLNNGPFVDMQKLYMGEGRVAAA